LSTENYLRTIGTDCETHAGVYAEEAYRPPCGKRASLAESTTPRYIENSNKVCENSLYLKLYEKEERHQFERVIIKGEEDI
jgi:hypothetical protein